MLLFSAFSRRQEAFGIRHELKAGNLTTKDWVMMNYECRMMIKFGSGEFFNHEELEGHEDLMRGIFRQNDRIYRISFNHESDERHEKIEVNH